MAAASKSQGGLSFLSTHPSGTDRIRILEANIGKVDGLYRAARRG
jgi:Zn-dependent protease with chaperone function